MQAGVSLQKAPAGIVKGKILKAVSADVRCDYTENI